MIIVVLLKLLVLSPGWCCEQVLAGKFGGRIKGAKYRFTLQDRTWDFPGDAIADRGLIFR